MYCSSRQGGAGQRGELPAVNGVAHGRVGGVSLEQGDDAFQTVAGNRVLRQVFGKSVGDGLVGGFQPLAQRGPGVVKRLAFCDAAAVGLKGQLDRGFSLVGAVADENAFAGSRPVRIRGRGLG